MRSGTAARTGSPARTTAWATALVALLGTSVTVAVTIGPADLSAAQVWVSIGGHLGVARSDLSPLEDAIIWELRLPRVLTAAAVGAGLALAGAVMQALTRNPLADPFLLGLSSGASLGAVLVMLLGVGLLLPVAAFAGAMTAMTVTLLLARSLGTITPSRTVLAGVAVSSLAAALTSLVVFWHATGDAYREVLSWILGSLAGADSSSVVVSGGVIILVGIPLVAAAPVLDAFAYGDRAATALGVHVGRTRWLLLAGTALLTGGMVSVSGSIGFVGLVLPNAVRLVVGARHRVLVPFSALCGATFMVWADTAARTMFAPRELPVGIITVLVGAPIFAVLLWRSKAVA